MHDFLGGHAVQVRALVATTPSLPEVMGPSPCTAMMEWAHHPGGERARRERLDEAIPGAHVVDGGRDAAERLEGDRVGITLRQLR